jgi:hypothetical protein
MILASSQTEHSSDFIILTVAVAAETAIEDDLRAVDLN